MDKDVVTDSLTWPLEVLVVVIEAGGWKPLVVTASITTSTAATGTLILIAVFMISFDGFLHVKSSSFLIFYSC
jgi:hypothetical protein